ncbi:MAG: IclR family transcriptional regulator [Castellaniella sp.]|uniref:IclR family transcriptional regulator n=1 Tax=Castellaniella sp. TaxID=1955812 RepID=UPI003A8A6A31
MQIDHVAAKGSSERVLLVLATLARLGRGAAISELIGLTGLAQSTLYRQLSLLRRWGFVIGRDNEFYPGPMCVPLAWGFDQSSFLAQESHERMETLSVQSGESIGLLVAVGHQLVCLDMVESQHPLRCSFVKGRILPLCRGASAKALLAFMHAEQRRVALDELERAQLLNGLSRTVLERQLDQIQALGYAASNGELDAGIWGASAPLFQHADHPAVAVITMMAPALRAQGQEDRLIEMTVRAAAHISSQLQKL